MGIVKWLGLITYLVISLTSKVVLIMCVELGGQICRNLANTQFKQNFKSLNLNYIIYSWVKGLDLGGNNIVTLSDLGFYLTITELILLALFTLSKLSFKFVFKLIFTLFTLISILTYLSCESLGIKACPPSLLTPAQPPPVPAQLSSLLLNFLKQDLNLQDQAIEVLSLSGFLLIFSFCLLSLKHLLQGAFASIMNFFLFLLNLVTLTSFLLLILQPSGFPEGVSSLLSNLANLVSSLSPLIKIS